MKGKWFGILIAFLVTFSALAINPELGNFPESTTQGKRAEKVVDPATTTDINKPVSDADAAQARKELENLAVAFGVKKVPGATSSTDTVTPAEKQDHKTLGDVGDKALDMVGKAVASLSATLEKVAPHVWKIMIRQQYAKAISGLVDPWGLLIVVIIYYRIIDKYWKLTERSSRDEKGFRLVFLDILSVVFGLVFCVWGVSALSDAIKIFINPEYYAIKDIITMLLAQAR